MAHRCPLRQKLWRTEHEKKIIGSLCLVRIAYWRRGTLVRQYIGAPIHPAHWKRNNLHVNYAGGVEACILHVSKRRTEQFGAPRLFSYQSPINWALQTGNGNTLQKRRRQH